MKNQALFYRLGFALAGLRTTWRSEHSFKTHVVAAAALPTFDALHAAADRALYAAKSAGRDGVMVAPTRLRRRPRRMRVAPNGDIAILKRPDDQ